MSRGLYPHKCQHLANAQELLRLAEAELECAQRNASKRRVHDTAQHLSGMCRRARYAIDKATRRTR